MALFLRDDGTFAAATIGGTVSVSQGGTGATTLTAHGVLLGESIGAIAATAAMSNGQILVGQTGADPTPQTVGGDATLSNAGSLVVTKTNNVSFAASATTDTTNAANISSGTLPTARLPAPTAATLGGVKSLAAVTHQFLTQIGTDGSVAQAQPAAADVSGLAASATTDTTNATNISSGTLNAARLPATAVQSGVATVFTRQQNFGTTALTDAATIAWDVSVAQAAKVTLAGNRAMGTPTNLVDGGTYTLRVSQDATGSRTLTYSAVFKWPGGTAPVLSTVANALDILTFISDGTNLYGVVQKAFG